MSTEQVPANFSSNLRWNVRHLQILIPTAAQKRLNGVYLGLVVAGLFGLWLSDQSVSSFWRLIGFGPPIVLAVWTWSMVVMWILGLRSGWMVEDDRLVIQGAVKRHSFGSSEIRSLFKISGLQDLSWTAINIYGSQTPFIAVGVPVADIPRILGALGLSENCSSDGAGREGDLAMVRDQSESSSPSFLSRLRWLLGIERRPTSEGEALVRRAQIGSGLNLTSDQVGLVRALKLADSLGEADWFGQVCGPGTVRVLADEIDDIEGLAQPEQMLDRLFVYLKLLVDDGGFETDQLMVAMGEEASLDRPGPGDLMNELLNVQARFGGIGDRGPDVPGSINNTEALAWACLAIARLGRVDKVPSLEDLPAWGVV